MKKKTEAERVAWQAAGDEGADIVRLALSRRALQRIDEKQGGYLLMAFGFGAISAATEFLAGISKKEGHAAIEQWAIGYVRAAMRGEKKAVHEDGRPMETAFDA